MEVVREHEFLSWAARIDIGVDQRYPNSGCLTILPSSDHARFWVLPADPGTWPHFVAWLLQGLDEWATGYLWPRSGTWPKSERSQSHNEGVRDVVLRGAGVPDGWAGAVRFTNEEEDSVLAILFVYLAFGWHVTDDLFFVPDHGGQVLQTDHHDVIHVVCASETRIQELASKLESVGYKLPTEPPDWTFKRPAWMLSSEPIP